MKVRHMVQDPVIILNIPVRSRHKIKSKPIPFPSTETIENNQIAKAKWRVKENKVILLSSFWSVPRIPTLRAEDEKIR